MKTKKKAPIIRIKGFDGDWEQRKLGEIASSFEYGLNAAAKEYDGENKYIRITDIDDNTHEFLSDDLTSPDIDLTDADNYKLAKGDILFARTGASVGKSYIYRDSDGLVYYAGFLIRAKIREEYDAEFVFQNTLTDKYNKYIAMTSQRSGQPGVNAQEYSEFEIQVPEKDEQTKIGAYFWNLDHLITLHQREIDRIVCLRKAMVEKMFPQNGADVPAVRFSRYKEPWRLCQFSEIFTERHIIDTISDEYPQLAFTIEEGVIRPEDKKTNKRDFLIIDKATKKYLQTEYDDIIYNPANVIYGAIHRNALGKGCVSPIYKIFYTDQDSTFMECIVRHPNFIKEISRSMEGTVKKLRTLKPKAFLEMSAYIAPTIEEQRQIGEYFRQMDRLIEIEKEELEKIKHIKSACLEKMFV